MKKIIAVLTAIIFLVLPLTACSSGEAVPRGMQLASAEGEPFKLYVPEGMNLNLDSGISGAFAHNPEKIVISARYYTPADAEMTVSEYISYCEKSYAEALTEFVVVSHDPDVLGGKDAIKLVYTAKMDSVNQSIVMKRHSSDSFQTLSADSCLIGLRICIRIIPVRHSR